MRVDTHTEDARGRFPLTAITQHGSKWFRDDPVEFGSDRHGEDLDLAGREPNGELLK
jgi:hypothetical protein